MLRLVLLLSLPLFLLDQWSKSWIVGRFPSPFDPSSLGVEEEVIPGIFWLHHAANTGVAFGMFNGTAYANYAFTFVSLAAFTFIVVMHRKGAFPGWMSRTAVALLIAGIFGNLTDRLFRAHATGELFTGSFLDGYVVDFLKFDFGFPPFNPWPSFNVADSCVVTAAILLALSTFFEKPEEKPQPAAPGA
ncbi:MAG: signal peptidase II [Verrucomicrobiaceae bacterium]|jgi:signal peptidase II|nr:signal peptidase II [Verrucomicrobiaceae bacterium]